MEDQKDEMRRQRKRWNAVEMSFDWQAMHMELPNSATSLSFPLRARLLWGKGTAEEAKLQSLHRQSREG